VIRVQKGPKPDVLVANENPWRDEFLAARAAGGQVSDTIRYRYRHAEIKAGLRAEAFEKCIYCERKVAFGEADHILAVVARPELIVAWENLGLTCKECNTFKADYYSETEPLINPFQTDPGQHLLFFGVLVANMVGDQLGFRTVHRLRLTRMDLVERRKERIERLHALMEQWQALPEGETKNLTRQLILEEAGDDREYAATVRAYLYQQFGWEYVKPGEVPV
jgi:hypothetical protein